MYFSFASSHDTPCASIHSRIQFSHPTKHVNSDWVRVWLLSTYSLPTAQSRTQSPQAFWSAGGRLATNRWPKSLRTLATRLPTAILVPRAYDPLISGWIVGRGNSNFVPRVFRLFGQRGNTRKTLRTSNFITTALSQDFCGKTMETVTKQPIKKIEFFPCPQSLPGVAPLTKKPEDSGYEIVVTAVTG